MTALADQFRIWALNVFSRSHKKVIFFLVKKSCQTCHYAGKILKRRNFRLKKILFQKNSDLTTLRNLETVKKNYSKYYKVNIFSRSFPFLFFVKFNFFSRFSDVVKFKCNKGRKNFVTS